MPTITSSVRIAGPIEQVFDLVTTTRYWPEWHPATIGVGGVTERPFALGDAIIERARLGGHEYEGTWTVTEHERPQRALLQGGSRRISIAYTFEPQGEVVLFRRELTYDAGLFSAADPVVLEEEMRRQSDQAVERLKGLVEELLNR
jgi:hypothetical protein